MAITYRVWKSPNPAIGDCVIDPIIGTNHIWTGSQWAEITTPSFAGAEILVPTKEQLEMYPALKIAWEEYLIVKRLIGQ